MQTRLLPEWSGVGAVLIAWPYESGDWSGSFQEVSKFYQNFLGALCEEIEVWVLVKPECKNEFNKVYAQLNSERVRVFNTEYNDTWVRDYAPLSTMAGAHKFQFDGWGNKYDSGFDNKASEILKSHFKDWRECNLVLEGGAVEVNDDGVLLANKDCVLDKTRNPTLTSKAVLRELRDELGITEFAFVEKVGLSGDDTDGHIDTLARFVNNSKVVYCGANAQHPDNKALLALESQLQKLANQFHWELQALPTPWLRDKKGRGLAATYANFLICNDTVFVPTYDIAEDKQALAVLTKVFPDKRLKAIYSLPLLAQNGSLHCATMQFAKSVISSLN